MSRPGEMKESVGSSRTLYMRPVTVGHAYEFGVPVMCRGKQRALVFGSGQFLGAMYAIYTYMLVDAC